MMKLAITGYPLLYTRSPALHRGFLRNARISGRYDVLPFNPKKGRKAFFSFLDGLASDGYRGLNVTVPLKEWAYDYAVKRGRGTVPGLHGRCAKLVRAANTLVFKTGVALAANTDAHGLWSDVEVKFKKKIFGNFDVVVIGTGGSARGVIAGFLSGQGLAKRAASIDVWGRDQKKVRRLRSLFKAKDPSAERACLVLWCLPPVSTREAKAIWKKTLGKHEKHKYFLYDLNYGERALSTEALVPRSRRSTGLGMLKNQARASFELWKS